MGTDKARLELTGKSLLERALGAFEGLATARIIATGRQRRYEELGLPCVLDRRPDGGPLAGLEAGLECACDMPWATPAAFEALLAEARGADACLLTGPRGAEPLFAVYHARVLPAVRSALDAGERRMISFHAPAFHAQGGSRGPLRVRSLRAERLGAAPAERFPTTVHPPDALARARARSAAALEARS
jgi:molybdopterin-guanine dinucleotide biosynthesis protein A